MWHRNHPRSYVDKLYFLNKSLMGWSFSICFICITHNSIVAFMKLFSLRTKQNQSSLIKPVYHRLRSWWSGPRFNIKMSSYQYRKSHCGDKTVVRSSYLHNGISYTGKMTSLYWFSPLISHFFLFMDKLHGKARHFCNHIFEDLVGCLKIMTG